MVFLYLLLVIQSNDHKEMITSQDQPKNVTQSTHGHNRIVSSSIMDCIETQ